MCIGFGISLNSSVYAVLLRCLLTCAVAHARLCPKRGNVRQWVDEVDSRRICIIPETCQSVKSNWETKHEGPCVSGRRISAPRTQPAVTAEIVPLSRTDWRCTISRAFPMSGRRVRSQTQPHVTACAAIRPGASSHGFRAPLLKPASTL
jgi:hypothetical protein